PEPSRPALSIRFRRSAKSHGASIFGCTLTVLTAGLLRSQHQHDLYSPRSGKRIRSRSIRTNGFTFQSIAAASCIAIRKLLAPPSPTKRNIPESSDRKRTKLSPFGITGRSFHGVFAHSKFGCC